MHLHLTHKCTNTQMEYIHNPKTFTYARCTTGNIQPLPGLGGYVHLAMRLHQQATIRDLHMQKPDWHIDCLRQGICIILYGCESVEREIECTVITSGVTCFSAIHVFIFICLIQTNHSVNSICATCDTDRISH